METRRASIGGPDSAERPQIGAPRRPGFTLVELLVTISIIAIMASLFLGAMYSSEESGRIAATKATIAKINNLVMQRYENYRTRRVPIYLVNSTNNANWPVISAGQRLDALRELMRLEMPDTWQDVISPPQTSPPGGGTPLTRPSLSSAYLRKYNALNAINSNNPTQANQGAECLYMICTTGISDELDNREQFRQNEIGDTDGDGAPEFLDAWGMPIYFIRWAPGFVSELQTTVDPDPFDPRHIYPSVTGAPGAGSVYAPTSNQKTPTFALYPLIFSGGPDKLYGINKPTTSNYAANNNDPFLSVYAGGGMLFGQRADVDSTPPSNSTSINAADDIFNHLMGTK